MTKQKRYRAVSFLNTKQLSKQIGHSHSQQADTKVTNHSCFGWGFPESCTGVTCNQ